MKEPTPLPRAFVAYAWIVDFLELAAYCALACTIYADRLGIMPILVVVLIVIAILQAGIRARKRENAEAAQAWITRQWSNAIAVARHEQAQKEKAERKAVQLDRRNSQLYTACMNMARAVGELEKALATFTPDKNTAAQELMRAADLAAFGDSEIAPTAKQPQERSA